MKSNYRFQPGDLVRYQTVFNDIAMDWVPNTEIPNILVIEVRDYSLLVLQDGKIGTMGIEHLELAPNDSPDSHVDPGITRLS